MSIDDPRVLALLACPDTHHAPLDHDPAARTLTCTECGRVFRISADGIPVLLLNEGRVDEGRVDEVRGAPAPEGDS